MRIFMCPLCGSIHKVKESRKMVFSFQACHHILIVDEDNNVRPLNPSEERHIDDGSFLGIPGTLKIGRGIELPMLDGGKANCRVGDSFFHVPDGFPFASFIGNILANGGDPAHLTVEEALQMALPQEACEVDVHKLRDLVGSIDWPTVNKLGNFLID